MDIYDMEGLLVLLAAATLAVCWTRHDSNGAWVVAVLVANYIASLVFQGSEYHFEMVMFMDFCVGVFALDASGRRVWGALVGLCFAAMMASHFAGMFPMLLAWLNFAALLIVFTQSWLLPQLRGKDIGDRIWSAVALGLHQKIGPLVG